MGRTKEEKIEAEREWKKNNRDKVNVHQKKWRSKNKEKLKEYKLKYKKKYPHKLSEYRRNRRAKQLNTVSEPYTTEQVLEMYGNNCHICNEPIDLEAPRWTYQDGWEMGLHIDHLIPLSKGGSDTIDNVRPAHGVCNLRKGTQIG